MKVLTFSLGSKHSEDIGWHRTGKNISYTQNNFKRENMRYSRNYYTLSFTYTFKHENDQVYFAHCFPYTYSDLVDDLNRIEKDRET